MSDPKWILSAKKYLGLQEGPGTVNNAAVVAMYAKSGHPEIKQDSVPWCAAYVGASLTDAKLPNTGSLAARSYESYGERLKEPLYGCIGVKKRRGGTAWQGHVGFVVAASADRVWLLGGNQGDKVSVASFPRDEFTAFVWPKGQPKPTVKIASSFTGKALTNATEA